MILTSRDLSLFSKLQSYGLLTTRQLEQFVFAGTTTSTVLRRLRILEGDGYIERVPLLEKGALAWSLTLTGSRMVGSHPPKRRFRPDLLSHELKLVSLRLELECADIAKSWIPEHEIRHQVFKKNGADSRRELLVPDALMGVKSPSGINESVAIELELNFKNTGRYQKILRDYRARKSLGYLWYVVSEPAIGKAALRSWQECRYPETKVQFYWSDLAQVMRNPFDATLHGADTNKPLKSVFESSEPALPPAHTLSREDFEKAKPNSTLTSEISS